MASSISSSTMAGFARHTESFLSVSTISTVWAARHRLSRRARVTVQDIANERWAWAEPSLLAQQRLREALRDASLPPPQPGLECRSTALLLRTVARSDLLTMISERFVRHVSDAK